MSRIYDELPKLAVILWLLAGPVLVVYHLYRPVLYERTIAVQAQQLAQMQQIAQAKHDSLHALIPLLQRQQEKKPE
jgi:hypothetical protein